MANRATFMETLLPAHGADATPYPDWRSIVHGLLQMAGEVWFGTGVGTGIAFDVALPFTPACVIVLNQTDQSIHVKTPTMAGATHMEMKLAAAWIAANGITLGVGLFTVGTSANLNANLDVLHYIAIGTAGTQGA